MHHAQTVRSAHTMTMRRVVTVGRAVLVAALIALVVAMVMLVYPSGKPAARAQPASGYVGWEKCGTCHPAVARQWSRTLHAKMVRSATRDNIHADLTKPNAPNLSEFDFAYVLGGWYKEERYVIRRGGELLTTPHEWDHVPRIFVIRRTGTGELEFSNWRTACVGCHTTGYNPQTRAWSELNITCESCHGPGARHAAAPSKGNIMIDQTAEACGSCHIRGTDNATGFGFPTQYRLGQPNTLLSTFTPIPMTDAASIFPDQRTSRRHRQQFIDFIKSKHYTAQVTCTACHDAHRGTEVAYSQLKKPKATLCNSCHASQAGRFTAHTGHKPWQVTCADCHTPRVIADGTVSTHTFRTLSPADSLKYGEDRMANSCTYKCHRDQNAAWAQRYLTEKGIGR